MSLSVIETPPESDKVVKRTARFGVKFGQRISVRDVGSRTKGVFLMCTAGFMLLTAVKTLQWRPRPVMKTWIFEDQQKDGSSPRA